MGIEEKRRNRHKFWVKLKRQRILQILHGQELFIFLYLIMLPWPESSLRLRNIQSRMVSGVYLPMNGQGLSILENFLVIICAGLSLKTH